VLEKLSMQDAKIVRAPLGVHFNLIQEQSPKVDEDKVKWLRFLTHL